MAYYRGSTYDRQSRRAVISADQTQWNPTLPVLSTLGEVAPMGKSTFPTERPAVYYAPRRSRDYSYIDPTEIWLVGQDRVYGGPGQVADYDWPNPSLGPKRSRDYSFLGEMPPVLQATPPVQPGQITTALPPRPSARSRDYTYVDPTEIWLIGQDAINPGQQLTQPLPPRGAPRSRDYTFLQWLELPVFGELPFGQSTFATDLPPKAARRAATLSEPGTNFTVWLDFAAQQVPPPGQSTAPTELPPRAAARSRDYSYVDPTEIWLIGTDAMVTGAQSLDLPPKTRQRAANIYEPGYDLTIWLDLASQAQIGPGKSTDATALPPRATPRSRDYSYTETLFAALIGTDAMVAGAQFTANPPRAPQRAAQLYDPLFNFTIYVDASTSPPLPIGEQSLDLPPKATPRARDYSWLNRLPNLIGQDASNPGKSTDATALPPRGPARSKDYTWLQSLPLHIYQQLPPGDSTLSSELPPKSPPRLKDYTFLHLSDTQLIGQDSMVVGQPYLDTDNVPPRAYARLRDYTWFQRFSLPELQLTTNPGHHRLSDRALFIHTLTDRALFEHTLTDRALILHNLRDQEAGG